MKLIKNNLLTLIFLAILIVLWGVVCIIGSTVGPYAWWGLMIFGALGILSVIVCIILLLVAFAKKKKVIPIALLLFVSLFASWPSLWFFGIGQIAYPTDLDAVNPSLSIRSPFSEPVIVAWGGDTIDKNYHVWIPCERWAYDIFAAPAVIESQNLYDYGIYSMDIAAPITGTVVGVFDGEQDHGTDMDDFPSMLGNYVFIEVEETGTYLVLAHLQYQSVTVEIGDYITAGTVIARVGNTGASSEPHLHIHHQRQNPNEILMTAEGLPLYFRDEEGKCMPTGGGDILKNGIRQPVGETILPG